MGDESSAASASPSVLAGAASEKNRFEPCGIEEDRDLNKDVVFVAFVVADTLRGRIARRPTVAAPLDRKAVLQSAGFIFERTR